MDTVLILADGRRVNALLLSATTDCLRVVIPGQSDTEEFRMVDGNWRSERGVSMEIGALLASGDSTASILPQAHTRSLTA